MIPGDGLATGGGIFGGAVSIAYAVKLLVEAKKESRTEAAGKPSPVSDAAAASSVLLGALQEERTENARLSTEVDELRQTNGDLYQDLQRERREHADELRTIRREYEGELSALRDQLLTMTHQLEDLQARIRAALPDDDKE